MKVIPGYEHVSLEKFSEQTMQYVDECRQLVGYQDDPVWECPYLIHGESFRDSFGEKSKYVGGFACYPCLVKETHTQASHNLPITASMKIASSKNTILSQEPESVNLVVE